MSATAYEIYSKSLNAQHKKNEARHIRTRVSEARKSPHTSGPRWPFELLQNALDAGPRPGRASVAVSLECKADAVMFDHDGAPFTSSDLAALLSGGSNKDFESTTTTGRFGTGFLVTHVLAERTQLSGLLQVPHGYEQVDLALDRAGDEDAILANIMACDDAIRSARPIPDITATASARFSYPTENLASMNEGIEAFRSALPLVFGTRPLLGSVRCLCRDGTLETWLPGELSHRPFKSGFITERALRIEHGDGISPRVLRVLRVSMRPDAPSAVLIVLEGQPDRWTLRTLGPNAPRLYREYPIRGSSFLPINFAIDGKFSVDQERSKILMSPEDHTLLREAFDAAILTVELAGEEMWLGRHLLAAVSQPASAFDANNDLEKLWWKTTLQHFANRLAGMPLVQTLSGFLPAVAGSGSVAAFPVPRSTLTAPADETAIPRLLPLMQETVDLHAPMPEIATEWAELAAGWRTLNVPLQQISLKELAATVRKGVASLDQLRVTGDKLAWLARFFDVVGECWQKRNGTETSLLDALLPNQKGALCGPAGLLRDAGITDELKVICEGVGLDVRSKLLTTAFPDLAASLGLSFLQPMLITAIPTVKSENEVLDECVRHLETALPEDADLSQTDGSCFSGSLHLLQYLWKVRAVEAAPTAKRLPLGTSRGKIVRWSRERMLMAPICKWHAEAQPFSIVYPEDRVLNRQYAGTADGAVPDVVPAMAQWGLCHLDPLSSYTPSELKERRLAALAENEADANGVTVSGQEFTQIALLQPEVLNRCQEGRDEAKALLGLVLCYIVRHDNAWQEFRNLKGRKAGADVTINARGALWLADLSFRAWVPVQAEDGKFSKAVPNAAILKDLIEAKWLTDNPNAIALLSAAFRFDALELRLLGAAPDESARMKLRNGLAKLIETAGADPATYEALATQLQESRRRTRDVERCRKFGLAVQDAVRRALVARSLELTLVDHGFDYEVKAPSDDPLADASFSIGVGSYLLEVKATTSGKPRLTPTQAQVASEQKARYVLCVVDLRSVPAERLDAVWDAASIEGITRIQTNIGDRVCETWALVDKARSEPVGIRNEATLRYEVPEEVWASGCSINSWVSGISTSES